MTFRRTGPWRNLNRLIPALVASALLLAACSHGVRTAPPNASHVDLKHARALFSAKCGACHGTDGLGGPMGPSLRHEKSRKTLAQTKAWIQDPQPPMPKLYPAQLSVKDLDGLAAFVQTL